LPGLKAWWRGKMMLCRILYALLALACHSRVGGNPEMSQPSLIRSWITACTGMTEKMGGDDRGKKRERRDNKTRE
jgi:hypothetical protein